MTGILALLTGYRLLDATGSETLASGYFVNACRSIGPNDGEGVCQMLQARFPAYLPPSLLPMERTTTPPHRRPSVMSNATARTTDSDGLPPDDVLEADNLDTVTLVDVPDVGQRRQADAS